MVFEVSPGIITAYPLSIDTLVNSIIPLDILFSELWNVTFSKVAVPELFTDLTFDLVEVNVPPVTFSVPLLFKVVE